VRRWMHDRKINPCFVRVSSEDKIEYDDVVDGEQI
jgi:hypothetical protein